MMIGRDVGTLRMAALVALAIAAIGTLICIFRVGHKAAVVLLVMFAGWDLAPLAALWFADARLRGSPQTTKTRLYAVMLVVAIGSLGIYGYVAYGPSRSQPAAPFLVAPVLAWVLIGLLLAPQLRRPR